MFASKGKAGKGKWDSAWDGGGTYGKGLAPEDSGWGKGAWPPPDYSWEKGSAAAKGGWDKGSWDKGALYGKGGWDDGSDVGKGKAKGKDLGKAAGKDGWGKGCWDKGGPAAGKGGWDSSGKDGWDKGSWPKGGWDKGCWDKGGPAACKGGWDKGSWDKGAPAVGKGGWDSGFDAGKGKAKGKDLGKTAGKSAGKGNSAKGERADEPQANGHWKASRSEAAVADSLRILVEGLPASATEENLALHFGPFGEVTEVSVQTSGRAVVTFGTKDGARMALEDAEKGAVLFEGTEISCKAFSGESPAAGGKSGGKGSWMKGPGETASTKGGMKRPRGEIKSYANDATIYVGNLPSSADEKVVTNYFCIFGKVLDVRLNYDDSGTFSGFGYVSFEDPDAAEAVLFFYSGEDWCPLDFDDAGTFIQCSKVDPGQPLRVEGRPSAKSGTYAQKAPQGDAAPRAATTRAAAPAGAGAGAGAIAYSSEWTQKRARYGRGPDDGTMVVNPGSSYDSWEGEGRKGKGWAEGWDNTWAGSAGDEEEEVIEEDKIWVGGLPGTITDQEISEHFSQFGGIKDINFKKGRTPGETRNFCFVTFDSAEATQAALAGASLGEVKPSYRTVSKAKGKGKHAGEAAAGGGKNFKGKK